MGQYCSEVTVAAYRQYSTVYRMEGVSCISKHYGEAFTCGQTCLRMFNALVVRLPRNKQPYKDKSLYLLKYKHTTCGG